MYIVVLYLFGLYVLTDSMAQWLRRWSLAGELSLIYA